MNQAHSILNEVETEYGVKFDPNFHPDALCDGTHCRHDECGCYEAFREAVEEEAIRLKIHSPQIKETV